MNNKDSVELTHNMMKVLGQWECVDCGRKGTIGEINRVKCTSPDATGKNVLDAITGSGKYRPRE